MSIFIDLLIRRQIRLGHQRLQRDPDTAQGDMRNTRRRIERNTRLVGVLSRCKMALVMQAQP